MACIQIAAIEIADPCGEVFKQEGFNIVVFGQHNELHGAVGVHGLGHRHFFEEIGAVEAYAVLTIGGLGRVRAGLDDAFAHFEVFAPAFAQAVLPEFLGPQTPDTGRRCPAQTS